MSKILIINPSGTSSLKKTIKQTTKGTKMKRRRKSKRSHASYVRAGKKAARSRKRRKNPTRHRVTVIATGRGKNKRLRRSPKYRLKPRRVNPMKFKTLSRKYFGKARMTNAIMLLVGLGGSGALKGFTSNFVPEGASKDWYQRLYGILSIIAGATLNMKAKKKEVRSIGTGMVVFGLYDVIVSNVEGLQQYLPAIAAPAAFSGEDYRDYGQMAYSDELGAGIQAGSVEVVGANNITAGVMPEIVGMEDMDLADALDMTA